MEIVFILALACAKILLVLNIYFYFEWKKQR
jgi:hypothetical protein